MNRLFGRKGRSKIFSNDELESVQVCPNCWGHQEYDSEYLEFAKDQTRSNINHDHLNKKAFIQQFVETHVSGILLKTDGEQVSCPRCKTNY